MKLRCGCSLSSRELPICSPGVETFIVKSRSEFVTWSGYFDSFGEGWMKNRLPSFSMA